MKCGNAEAISHGLTQYSRGAEAGWRPAQRLKNLRAWRATALPPVVDYYPGCGLTPGYLHACNWMI